VGFGGPTAQPTDPPGSVRTFPVTWSGRSSALLGLLELLDPERLAVWTADRSEHAELGAVLDESPGAVLVSRGEVVDAPLVVCHDLPTPSELAALGAGREVVLLVPPGTEGYAARIAPAAHPLREAGAADLVRDRDALLRAEIVDQIEHRDLTAAGYAIAPLFDRFDAQAIAAACFGLWRRGPVGVASGPGQPEVAPRHEPPTPVGGVAMAKLWVGVGRRDEATTGDLVAVLIKEVGLTREAIGRIELRETFSLVEVPVDQADRIAQALSGLTIRRRRLLARVDRGIPARSGGPGRPSGGPAGRGGGGGRPPRR
jgi:ATP-dependent RNA helicase DeaD